MKDIIGNSFDFRKNRRSAQPRQAQLPAQSGLHFLRQASSQLEKLAGAGDFKGQQFPPAGVGAPGAQIIETAPRLWTLQVEGFLGPLLETLRAFPVKDLEVVEPKLEDVVLQYYREDRS